MTFFSLLAQADPAAPLMLPDSVQKARWADTIQKLATVDWHDLMKDFISDSIWIGLKILVALAIYSWVALSSAGYCGSWSGASSGVGSTPRCARSCIIW